MIVDRKNNTTIYKDSDDENYYYITLPNNLNTLKQISIDYDGESDVVDFDTIDTDIDSFNDVSSESLNEFIKDNWNIITHSNNFKIEKIDRESSELIQQSIEEYGYGMDNYPPSSNADLTHQNLDYDWKIEENSVEKVENQKDYDAYHRDETKSAYDKAYDKLKQINGVEPTIDDIVNYLRNQED